MKIQVWVSVSGYYFDPLLVLEEPLVSEDYNYGGTPDFYGVVDDKYELIDFKSGSGIYEEHYIQLSAYQHLIIETRGEVPYNLRILNIPRSDDESFMEEILTNKLNIPRYDFDDFSEDDDFDEEYDDSEDDDFEDDDDFDEEELDDDGDFEEDDEEYYDEDFDEDEEELYEDYEDDDYDDDDFKEAMYTKNIISSYICEECDYKWTSRAANTLDSEKYTFLSDEEDMIICPMCGSSMISKL